MRKTIKTSMFAIILLATSSAANAQTNVSQSSHRGINRPSPEKRIENMAKKIANQLGLDEKTSKKFQELYKKEQNDMMETMPSKGSGMPQMGGQQGNPPMGGPQGNPPMGGPQGNPPMGGPQGNPPSMNGGQPMGGPQMSETKKKDLDAIKKKYNKKYAKLLSQEQINKMHEIQEQERQKNRPNDKHKPSKVNN